MINPIHQLFGLFDGKYYAMDDNKRIVIPSEMDYKTQAIMPRLDTQSKCAEVDIFRYVSDLVTECNVERVKFMKEFLLNVKVTDIPSITDSFVLGVKYELYNKNGDVVRAGTSEVDAKTCTALLMDEVKTGNVLEYRKSLVLDSRLVITIPEIACYGIRNFMSQHPYTLKITEIYALATNGGYKHITESGTQQDMCDCGQSENHCHHASNAGYHIHHHNGLCDMNFNSCFVTNANIGTTIIDNTVASAILQAPVETERINICSIELTENNQIKFNAALNQIAINLELLIDNLLEVYDKQDIAAILESNANPPIYPEGGEDEVEP